MQFKISALVASIFCFSSISSAEKQLAPNHLMLGAGIFDVDKDHPQFQYQLEYRKELNWHHVRPLVGFSGTSKGSFYIFGGAGWDLFLSKQWILTPSFAPGLYFKGGGKDLGCIIEFRSAIELSYNFSNQSRLGAQFYHVSNASIGHKNPGEESLIFFFAIPL